MDRRFKLDMQGAEISASARVPPARAGIFRVSVRELEEMPPQQVTADG